MSILIYLIFTIPVCLILTRALYQSSRQIILTRRRLIENNIKNINKQDIISIANIYIIRKQWLFCILMLEKSIDKELKTIELYNCLGFCYLSTKLYKVSEHYYKKALRIDPSNIRCLKSLANLYSNNHMDNKAQLEDIHKQIDLYIS